MSITPTGYPCWTKTADNTTYGGNPDKRNYQQQGVVNSRTDVGAEQFARLTADLAAVQRTAEFGKLEILMNGAGNPTVNFCELMTGRRIVSYSGATPPTGFPAVSTQATGDVIVSFDSSYDDEYGISALLQLKAARANSAVATNQFTNAQVTGNTTVRVKNYSITGTLTDGTVLVRVWT